MTDVTRADENAAKDLLSIILYAPYPFALRKTAEHFARQRVAFAQPPASGVDRGCRIPPAGWWCSRERGHKGPCAARQSDRPVGAGWSTPPTEEAAHDERLTAEELRALGLGVSEWAYNHLAKGYAVSLTVREIKRLIAALANSGAPVPGDGGGALADIAAERERQQAVEGWTVEHDDQHGDGSMALAAACYAMFASVSNAARSSTDMPAGLTVSGKPLRGWAAFLTLWPWDRKWWKPKSRRHDLVRAAALIVAEIERLDRKERRA